MNKNTIVIEKDYNAPIAKVWKALTDKTQMKQWYFDVSDFKPEVGFEFTFTGGTKEKQYVHKCKVIEATPVTRLSHSWRYEGYEGNSVVTWELTPTTSSTTHLKLTHTGVDSFPADDPNFAPSSFNKGWEYITGTSLVNMVETDLISLNTNIKASAENIMQVLTDPNDKWALAFGGGAIAISDWKEGSSIRWTDLQHNPAATGIITIKTADKLELQYFNETDPKPGDEPGEYTERFTLKPLPDGTTDLYIEAGPLQKKYIGSHKESWDKTLPIIKKTAEK